MPRCCECLHAAFQVERFIFRPEASGSDLTVHFIFGMRICVKKRVMPKIELRNHDTGVEPVARFPSDAEIALAERLRHQLEERYLVPSAAPSPLPARSVEGH